MSHFQIPEGRANVLHVSKNKVEKKIEYQEATVQHHIQRILKLRSRVQELLFLVLNNYDIRITNLEKMMNDVRIYES